MTCQLITEKLDDYIDGELDSTESGPIDEHLDHCADCRSVVREELDLRDRLRDYGESSMPQPEAAFYDQAIARAAQEGTKRQRNRWVMTGFGGAVAAALVLWVVSGIFFATPEITGPPVPSVTMALEEPRTLNLVFSSTTALADATMTVVLPEGVEIEGFPGQREITWLTSLNEGENILPLTLIATSPRGGELLATLQHEDDDKTFRLQVKVI